jgi:hypothetical protein
MPRLGVRDVSLLHGDTGHFLATSDREKFWRGPEVSKPIETARTFAGQPAGKATYEAIATHTMP